MTQRLTSRLSPTDLIGLALIATWILWAATTSLINGGQLSPTSPYVVAPLMVALGVALGRGLASRPRSVWGEAEWNKDDWVDVTFFLATTVFLLWELWRGGAGGGPLGYANANAALAVQMLAACGLSVLGSTGTRRRARLAILAGIVGVVLLVGSRAGNVLAVAVLLAITTALTRRIRRRWWSITIGALALGSGGTAGVVMAGRPVWPDFLTAALDPARQTLWSDAWMLWQLHPITGGAPGSFQRFSPLAADPDTSTVHSSVLQVGAETGAVGVVLFAALIAAGFATAAQGQPRAALIAGAAWTALVLHSFVDHPLGFPPVVLMAGVVIGWAGALRSEKFDVGQGQGPVRW